MSAPHDTPEAVERKASILGTMALYNFGEGSAGRDILNEAAAMLRHLHQRAVEAEAVADQAVWAMEEHKAALATARADALKEAMTLAYSVADRMRGRSSFISQGRMAGAQEVGLSIEALIAKELK